MSELQTTDASDHIELAEVHSEADRYDGSRTPADKQLLVWQLAREGRSVTAIADFLGMNPYTVKAVIARRDSIIGDARMLLKANALEFAHDAILASKVAAEKGKIEGISAMLDRLDVTQPPKSQQSAQVAVQINLNGGPEPQSLVVDALSREVPTETGANLATADKPDYVNPQVVETIGVSEPQRKTGEGA
jgi:predicted transcriptional regulator